MLEIRLATKTTRKNDQNGFWPIMLSGALNASPNVAFWSATRRIAKTIIVG
jgi:hypothetical protein